MAHGEGREGKWRDTAASTLHTTSEHCPSSITTNSENIEAAKVSRELSSEIIELVSTSLFPYNT
jgi:hypothetical protein